MISIQQFQQCCNFINNLPGKHPQLNGVSRQLSKKIGQKIYLNREDGIKAIVDLKSQEIEIL